MPSFHQIAISGGGRVTLRILCKFGREDQLLCLHSQGWIYHQTMFFPTCQVRVVRFYQGCSSPPPSSSSFLLLLLLRVLLLLFYHLCLHFHVHCCLANSWPSSSPTSELSAHCWTSTWDLPSSMRTAGPQPGTCRAQCASLDLNLGPSELSAHRWTSKAR